MILKLAYVLVALCMVLVAIPHARSQTSSAISCTGVEETLSPCLPHLKSRGPSQAVPPEACCIGVRNVKAMARTTPERRAVCQCLTSLVANIQGLNTDLAAKLPAQCGVTMSYTLSPNTDCTTVGQ